MMKQGVIKSATYFDNLGTAILVSIFTLHAGIICLLQISLECEKLSFKIYSILVYGIGVIWGWKRFKAQIYRNLAEKNMSEELINIMIYPVLACILGSWLGLYLAGYSLEYTPLTLCIAIITGMIGLFKTKLPTD